MIMLDGFLLATTPEAGGGVPGMGGTRKRRFAAAGQGRRGAFRVIHYVPTDDMPILALLIYGRGEQVNPTPKQKRAVMAVVAGLKTLLDRGEKHDQAC